MSGTRRTTAVANVCDVDWWRCGGGPWTRFNETCNLYAKELDVADEVETEVDDSASRKMDDELRVLGSILRALGNLEEKARARCLAYLWSRFGNSP
jgi:hypothetical protein